MSTEAPNTTTEVPQAIPQTAPFQAAAPQFYHPVSANPIYRYSHGSTGMMPLHKGHAIPPSYNRLNGPVGMYMNPSYTMAPPAPQKETENKEEAPETEQVPVQPPAQAVAYTQPMSYAGIGGMYRPTYQPTIRYQHQVPQSHYFNSIQMPQSQYTMVQSAAPIAAAQNQEAAPQAEPSQEKAPQAEASQTAAPAPVTVHPSYYMQPSLQPIHSYAAPFTTRSTLLPQTYSYQPHSYQHPFQPSYQGTFQSVGYPYAAPVVAEATEYEAIGVAAPSVEEPGLSFLPMSPMSPEEPAQQ